MKHFSVVCVCVFSLLALLPPVFGLECYTTDLQVLKQQKITKHHISNCADSIRGILRQQGWTDIHVLPQNLLKCYKAVVHGDKVLDVKGCVVNGGCTVIKETFEKLYSGDHISVDCYECEGNNCNTGSPGAKITTGALLLLAAMLLF